MQRRHALVVKGDLAADEDVEDNAKAPDVDLGSRVELGVEEFGGGKVEGTAEGAELGDGGVEVREAKVDDLDVARLGDEDVFDLEICQSLWSEPPFEGQGGKTHLGERLSWRGSTRARSRSVVRTCARSALVVGRAR